MAGTNNYFDLTLDTLAPTGSITRPTQYVNAQTTLTITKGDATFMYIWFDQSASTSEIPSGTSPIAAADSFTSEFTNNGVFYYHVVLEDTVGNRSTVYTTDSITYDTVAPVVNSVEICNRDGSSTEITKTREMAIKFTATDASPSSGLVTCAISGDINVDSTAWSSTLTADEISTLAGGGAVQRNIVLSGTGEEETTKTVNITVTDAAGNTSSAVSDTITLDTQFLTGNIVIKDSADTKTITDTWVNFQDIKVKLELGSATAGDVVGYKVWGDINDDGGATATTEPASYTTVTTGTNPIDAKINGNAIKLTSGDSATKAIHAKVVDDAGNEVTLTSVNMKADYSAPTVSIALESGATKFVSKVSGFTTKVLVPTFDGTISGIKEYVWKMDGTAHTGGSGTGDPTNFTVDSANLGDTDGDKAFTLTVTDNAGNTTTSTAVNVYLDTTAPTKTTLAMEAWYNGDAADQTTYHKFSAAGVTASAADGNGAGVTYMTVWCDQVADTTTVPSTATQIAYAANPGHGDVDWTNHAESATNYIHIKYVDAVGNAAVYHSSAFGIDTVVPDNGAVTFTKEAYPSVNATVVLTFSDATSGMGSGAKFKIWGSAVDGVASEADASWEAIASSKALTMTTGDGEKQANVKYMDVAGNMSTTAVYDTTELDTSKPAATVALKVTGTDTAKPAYSNVSTSDMRVTCSEATTGKEFYQIYGDFTTGSTQEAQGLSYHACTLYAENVAIAADALILYEGNVYKATEAITAAENTGWSAISAKMEVNTEYWKEYSPETGKDYVQEATICTSGDGTKTFYARVMDNAGNISDASSVAFVYDTTAPTVVVSDVDHRIISKVHSLRLKNESGTISELTTYNDETKFKFTPDSDCQAYKVVAYVSEAAAEAGSHADAAIPTTAGSVNMSASGIEFGPSYETKTVSPTIKGADYESALLAEYDSNAMTQAEAIAAGFTFEDGEVNGIDGAHFVVVYVQDLGGTWSVAATIEA